MAGLIVAIPYRPRPLQRAIHDGMDTHRFGAVVCHRRFGKTVAAINHLQRAAMTCAKERPRFGYIAPTYTQGKSIAWDYLKHYAAPVHDHEVNESELRITFPQNDSQVRIFGADNPDSLRGLYFDGVVLDEYGLMPPRIYTEVIRAALSDRQGWALFMGTPNGRNQFYKVIHGDPETAFAGARYDPDWFFAEYKASATGVLNADELADARRSMTADEYAQEYECSFEASVKGAIFAREVQQAREQGRITRVPYDPVLPVDTDWDLGVGDATAIWFSQTSPSGEVRLIDYEESAGKGLPYFKQLLNDKTATQGYVYGTHWAPHDIAVRELGTGRSRLEAAISLGIHFQITPRVESLEDGIHAARMLFPRCWFDRERCEVGLEALQHYHWKPVVSQHPTGKPLPVHDWASHGADAFRGLGYRHYTPKFNPERKAAAALRKAQKDTDPRDTRVRRSVRGGY